MCNVSETRSFRDLAENIGHVTLQNRFRAYIFTVRTLREADFAKNFPVITLREAVITLYEALKTMRETVVTLHEVVITMREIVPEQILVRQKTNNDG